jgi:hypothetical protein
VLREAREVERVVNGALLGGELMCAVGTLIGAAGRGGRHGCSLSLRIDDARVEGTAIRDEKGEKL